MSHATARMNPAVTVAVIVGVLAIVAIFVIIGIFWVRKTKFTHKSQPTLQRANTTSGKPDSVVMSYFQPHDLSVQLPKPLPRVYDPGTSPIPSSYAARHQNSDDLDKSSLQEPLKSHTEVFNPHQEAELTYISSPSSRPFPNKHDVREIITRFQSGSTVTLASLPNDAKARASVQNFGHSGLQEPTHVNEENTSTKHRPSHLDLGLLLTPPTLKPWLPSPPLTPTTHLPTQIQGQHETDIDAAFKFPSTSSNPHGLKLTVMPHHTRSSLHSVIEDVTQEGDEDHMIWSDVFSLEDYGREDPIVRDCPSTGIHDQLPSPPPTPMVFFTPPSPPTILPTPTPTIAEMDGERLHAWRSGGELVQVTTGNADSRSKVNNNGAESPGLSARPAVFALGQEQAKAAQARRAAKMESHFGEDSPPAYQSLKFDFETRLAQKRASSPFTYTTVPDKSTTRTFLDHVTAIMRPRPPLDEFEPLLCRKIDISRRVFSGFSVHPVRSHASNNPTEIQPAMYTTVETLETSGGWTENEESATGLAV